MWLGLDGPVNPQQVLAPGRCGHPEGRVLPMSDESDARIVELIRVERGRREATQPDDLGATAHAKLVVHRLERSGTM